MEAKLIKVDNGWVLMVDNIMYATDENAPYARLSLKNCEAIVNSYDLDELAEKKYPYEKTEMFSCFELDCKQEGFIEGAKTILEILGDKKFSEDDVNLAFVLGKNKDESRINKLINSKLQQTEWNVIIEMEDSFTKNDEVYVDETNAKGNYSTHSKNPLLDADGCLILKRK